MDVDLSDRPHSLVHIFSRHPIYDNILSRLSPHALTRMSSVNRTIRAAVHDFSSRAYNVNRRLSRFVDDPLSFRSLMARTHMVISGSFALQLFDRTYYPDSDLDLYVHPDHSILEVGVWLEKQGYTYLPRSWQRQIYADEVEHILATIDLPAESMEDETEATQLYQMKSLRAVYSFERTINHDIRKIQVIVPRIFPLASILEFHSSAFSYVSTGS